MIPTKKTFLIAALLWCSFFSSIQAQTTIKTLFYNLLYYPSGAPANRELNLKFILDEYQPDIFTVCELETAAGADEILTQSIQATNPNFARATFVSNQSDPSADNQLHQLLFYNTDKFDLVNEQIHTTYIRDINQYTLELKTPDQATNPIRIEYFVAHFKSSDGTANKNIRLDMANVFAGVLPTLDPNAYVVFSGDFNFYTSSEPAYQKILDNNNAIIMRDPINDNSSLTSWNNNSTYQAIHTQATRVFQLNGNGAYSGMDDRFDFSFISENIFDGSADISYVNGTYSAYGNNGNCYNKDINDPSCTGTYSQSLRDNIFIMSDHTPVVMELEYAGNILGVNDEIINSSFGIYGSNVVNKELKLSIQSNFETKIASIYNSLGQEVHKFDVLNQTPYFSEDISHLANGMYFIKTNNIPNTIKFIKSN